MMVGMRYGSSVPGGWGEAQEDDARRRNCFFLAPRCTAAKENAIERRGALSRFAVVGFAAVPGDDAACMRLGDPAHPVRTTDCGLRMHGRVPAPGTHPPMAGWTPIRTSSSPIIHS